MENRAMSPQQIACRGIAVIASMSFMVGIMLFLGLAAWKEHEPQWYVFLHLMPIVAGSVAVVVNRRRVLSVVS
jgi:hypothetical protein